VAAIQRGLCILETAAGERKGGWTGEVHQRLKRFYGKLHSVTWNEAQVVGPKNGL